MADDQHENCFRRYQNTNQVCLPKDVCFCLLTDLKKQPGLDLSLANKPLWNRRCFIIVPQCVYCAKGEKGLRKHIYHISHQLWEFIPTRYWIYFGPNNQDIFGLWRLQRWNFDSEQFWFYWVRYNCIDTILETDSF